MADALSRKSYCNNLMLQRGQPRGISEVEPPHCSSSIPFYPGGEAYS